jgi:Glycine-rich domain-containing protein-like
LSFTFQIHERYAHSWEEPVLWNAGIAFPLEQLHRLISTGVWTDLNSQEIWDKAYPDTPYQLWNSDPTTTTDAVLRLQDIHMTCSWCQNDVTFDLRQFQAMYTENGICRCSSCGQEFSKESLGAQSHKNDLHQFETSKAKARWYSRLYLSNFRNVKGLAVNRNGSLTGDKVYNTLEILLRNNKLDSSKSIIETLSSVKSGKIKDDILTRLDNAYNGILWRDFSIDLVAASLRQREFTHRLMHECEGIDSHDELSNAISRYHKFLQLMKIKNSITGKHIPLVPTLDIDLAWHTHQLFPQSYRSWCMENIGRAINHDDTFGHETITDGLRSTSLAWLEEFGEAYTTKNLRKAYFTVGRKVIGIMFPPYGLVMLRVGRKLDRARLGISVKCFANVSHCAWDECW